MTTRDDRCFARSGVSHAVRDQHSHCNDELARGDTARSIITAGSGAERSRRRCLRGERSSHRLGPRHRLPRCAPMGRTCRIGRTANLSTRSVEAKVIFLPLNRPLDTTRLPLLMWSQRSRTSFQGRPASGLARYSSSRSSRTRLCSFGTGTLPAARNERRSPPQRASICPFEMFRDASPDSP